MKALPRRNDALRPSLSRARTERHLFTYNSGQRLRHAACEPNAMCTAVSSGRRPQLIGIAAILARFPFYNTFIDTPPKPLFSKGRGILLVTGTAMGAGPCYWYGGTGSVCVCAVWASNCSMDGTLSPGTHANVRCACGCFV